MKYIRMRHVGVVIAVSSAGVTAARAEPFVFTMNGYFYGGASLSGAAIADGTPFSETASFNTSSPNLINAPDSVIYVPSSASITFSGTTYQIAPYSASTPYGVGVAILGQNSPFPADPEYGVALIGNPPNDGSGLLADFLSATPNISANNLKTTVFPASEYVGTGITSGVCTSAPETCFAPTQTRDIEPIPLTANGQTYALALTNGVPFVAETLDTEVNDPNAPPPGFVGLVITTPFSASLTDVPEPGSMLILGVGIAALPLIRRARAG